MGCIAANPLWLSDGDLEGDLIEMDRGNLFVSGFRHLNQTELFKIGQVLEHIFEVPMNEFRQFVNRRGFTVLNDLNQLKPFLRQDAPHLGYCAEVNRRPAFYGFSRGSLLENLTSLFERLVKTLDPDLYSFNLHPSPSLATASIP